MPFVRMVNPSPRRRRGHFGLDDGSSRGGEHMKMKKHHKRRFGYHRNPILGMSGGDLLVETAGAVINGVATRLIPQALLGANNTGIVGYAANAATGLAGAWLASKFSPKAGHGALLGAAVAVASRILSDTMGQNALGGGLSGDMGGELGFYVNSAYPLPQASNGPLMLSAGVPGGQSLSWSLPGQMPAVVTTAAGTQAVAAGGAGGSNAALATASQPSQSPAGVWASQWAA